MRRSCARWRCRSNVVGPDEIAIWESALSRFKRVCVLASWLGSLVCVALKDLGGFGGVGALEQSKDLEVCI
jgi:hypothetical protein